MAKLITNAKVTVTIDDGKDNLSARYTATNASLSSDGWGGVDLSIHAATCVSVGATETEKSVDEKALCDPEPTKADRMLEELVIKAQIIEIEGLEAAFEVDKALKEERRRNAKASHAFNMAVLAYLHAGGTEEQAVAKLEELNLGFFEQVEEVSNLDLDALYSLGRED